VLLLPMSPPPVATVKVMPELLESLEMVAATPLYCCPASRVAEVVEPKETAIGVSVTVTDAVLVVSFTLVAVSTAVVVVTGLAAV